jgi:integrase
MPLTDTAIRNAKPALKPVKLFDERGLFLLVTSAGGKWWRFRFRFDGKEKLLSLGVYPDVGLKDARNRRDEARKLLAEGTDPGEDRKTQKSTKLDRAANSFEAIAREWFGKFSSQWVEHHGQRVMSRFERDIFPWIGGRPIAEVTAPESLGKCSQIFRYAVATGRCSRDPSGDLRGALQPTNAEHFASVTEPAQVAALLRALGGYEGTFTVACALRLAPYVFVRPGELRKAEWTDFDLDAAEWRYMVTKTNTPHIVPLASQAVAILRELHALTGTGRYVFPGARSSKRPMSDNAILAAMRRLGIGKDEMSGHGFRAMARTILDEVLGVRPDYIEHQLAHAVKDPNGRAYNRTSFLPERREMMQQWADYLDKLKTGVEVIVPHGSGV